MTDERDADGEGEASKLSGSEFRIRSREELAQLKRKREYPNTGLNPDLRGNPTLQYKLQRISEMGFDKEALARVPEGVLSLTVSDLDDFAKKMVGLEIRNPRVDSLTLEEIQGIEFLFTDNKEQVLATVASKLREGGEFAAAAESVDVSCCCCTP